MQKLRKIYGLKTPQQIKERILWNHIQAITLRVFGMDAKKRLRTMDDHFTRCERNETSPE